MHFQTLQQKDGLANDLCYKMLADTKGRMYIGTQNGLSIWYGNRFKTLRGEGRANASDFAGRIIKDILPDSKGMLWISSQGAGLSHFNPETEKSIRFTHQPSDQHSLSSNETTCLFLQDEHTLWIGTMGYGLNRMDLRTKKCTRIPLTQGKITEEERLIVNSVSHITRLPDDPGALWMACNNGVYRVDLRTLQVQRFPSARPYTEFMSVHKILPGPRGHCWLATYGGGVALFRLQDKHWEYFPALPEAWANYSSRDNIVLDLLPGPDPHTLWAATEDMGLGLFHTIHKTYTFYNTLPSKPNHHAVNALYQDPAGRLWVANYKQGVGVFDPRASQFNRVPMYMDRCQGMHSNEITDFAESRDGQWLFVTSSGCAGFYVFKKSTQGNWEFYQKAKATGYAENTFLCVTVDAQQKVWVGGNYFSWSGGNAQGAQPTLWQYDLSNNTLTPVRHPDLDRLGFQKQRLNDAWTMPDGTVWFSVNLLGLLRYDPVNQRFHKYEIPTYAGQGCNLQDVCFDAKGRIFLIAQKNELWQLDVATEKFKRITLPFEDELQALTTNQEGHLWLAVEGLGIRILNPDQPVNQQAETWLDDRHGLPFPKILHLEKTPDGTLWCATETGICKWNAGIQRFEVFGEADGLPDAYYYDFGFHAAGSGNVYTGQQGGFAYQMQRGKAASAAPALLLTGLRVQDGNRYREYAIGEADYIQLGAHENSMTLYFSALDYTRPDKIRYAYRMEGVQESWITTTDHKGEAVYTQLAPGNYTFSVSATDANGAWIPSTRSLRICIAPPWWRSPWAYSLYAVLLMAGAWYLYQNWKKRVAAQRDAASLKALDALKTELYANVTHEFRTPLTLIIGPAERALAQWQSRKTESMGPLLEGIVLNGKRLLQLVNQLLDLRKTEDDPEQLHLERGDVRPLLSSLMDAAAPMAKIQQIQWELEMPEVPMDLEFDRDKLSKVVQNLLSNALKFTLPGGTVRLRVPPPTAGSDSWSVHVEDTGIGIAETHLPHVFDRYYQVPGKNAPSGTGIGLALVKLLVEKMGGSIQVRSAVGKGSTFSVVLPVHYNKATERGSLVVEDEPHHLPVLLVAEDNPEILAYIVSCLPGFRTLTAANGAEALQLALETVPDAVITDWMMPEMDGLELCTQLKNAPSTSHIPILLLTARNTVEDRLKGLRRGADVYLTKPFVEEELLLEVHRLIALKDRFLQRYVPVADDRLTSSSTADSIQQEDLAPEDEFMVRMNAICQEHLTDSGFTVELMGKAMAMSHTQLHRKMTALTGKSPVQYLRHVRLQKAVELLKDPQRSVAEIAFQCGFEDPSYFTRIFTREMGKTPTQYRENA